MPDLRRETSSCVTMELHSRGVMFSATFDRVMKSEESDIPITYLFSVFAIMIFLFAE